MSLVRSVGEVPRCTLCGTTGLTMITTLHSTLYFVTTTLYSTLCNLMDTPHTTTLYSTWHNRTDCDCHVALYVILRDYHVVLYVAQPEGYPPYYHVVLNVVQLSTTLYSTWYNWTDCDCHVAIYVVLCGYHVVLYVAEPEGYPPHYHVVLYVAQPDRPRYTLRGAT